MTKISKDIIEYKEQQASSNKINLPKHVNGLIQVPCFPKQYISVKHISLNKEKKCHLSI